MIITCRSTAPAAPPPLRRLARAGLLAASLCAVPCATHAEAWTIGDAASLRAVAPATDAPALRAALDAAVPAMPGWKGGLVLHDPAAVRALYAVRGGRPVWTTAAAVRTLQAAVASGATDGLDVAALTRLHAEVLGTSTDVSATPVSDAERELRLTDLLLHLRARLRHGTTLPDAVSAPEAAGPDSGTPDDAAPRLARLSAQLDAGDVATAVAEARPDTPLYGGLRVALARHLERAADGGLPAAVGAGPTLGPASEGPRVARLRARLRALDALDGLHGPHGDDAPHRSERSAVSGTTFDDALEASIEAFQERSALQVDGRAGRLTVAAVDVSLDARIERLRLNLERARHIDLALADDDRIVVNVADQRLVLELDGRTTWESDVVVGKRRHRTPVHVDEISYLELDPTWNVPRRIVMDTLYERARLDPAAFANEGFVLRDTRGRWRDPREIDWESMTPERFHYDVVQRPGPRNPLGRVKFMFPNRYAVYLHDTPDRSLFDEDLRAFSRGCVRVEDADTLAALLLEHRNDVHRPDIVTMRAAADEVRVDLKKPLLVALLYWTAEVDEDGTLRTLADPYARDPDAVRALADSARG